ncbi:MAG: DNA primase [Cognaticolwellia sp.]|jgi:DNA primase
MIEQKTIAEIFETAKVDEVVGDFVNLRRRGVNMIGLCPFHNEKTPSFTVSPAKGIYKCFGCGQGGNSVNFIMEHEQASYPDALRYLAKKYGIKIEEKELTPEQDMELKRRDSLFILNDFAVKYYHDNLTKDDVGKSVGLSYFKERGYRKETIEKFQLGFAFDKKDHLTLQMVNKGYNQDLLKSVGLTTRYGRDFFRNRVQFPIHNLSGKVIGFGGRILVTDKKQPKYLNTPESEIYNKSKVLYGIYFAKKAIRQEDNCFLVEGYTDVISLNQAGVENVVSSSGTSLTVGQIQLIKRYTPNITILYDGDAAGIKAALRGLDLVLEQDMNVKVVLLPEGEDPDSFVQSVGTEKFKEYIAEKAADFILFKTNLILKETANDPIKRATLIKDIVESIARIPDPIKRSVFVRECANLMQMSEQILVDEANKAVMRLVQNRQKEQQNEERRRQREQQRTPNTGRNHNLPTQPPSNKNRPNNTGQNDNFAGLIPPSDSGDFPPFDDGGMPFDDGYQGNFTDSLPPNVGLMPVENSESKRAAHTYNDDFQEKDIVRILMLFGTETFTIEKEKEAEEWQVAVYVLSNMEDVLEEFDNPLYKKIVHFIYDNLAEEKFFSAQDFVNHEDKEIQKLAIDLSTSPYEYSDNWINRFEKPLSSQPMPDDNFKADAIKGVNVFKLIKIQRVYEKNQRRLKGIGNDDFEEMMRLLKIQKKLMDIRSELAELTGTVVLR